MRFSHIHLLIDDPDDRKSDAMHAVAVSYAGRYNARTGHIGHVFQERFWDSPIKSEVYLLEAIRYIHLNPQKAGLAAYDEYPWSSHREYLMSARSRPHVTGSVVGVLFPTPRSYLQLMESAPSLPYRPSATAKVREEDLCEFGTAIVQSVAGCAPTELKSVSKPLRNEAILALRKEGLTVRQDWGHGLSRTRPSVALAELRVRRSAAACREAPPFANVTMSNRKRFR